MAELNSHDLQAIYDRVGIDLDTLGCVMLRVEPVDVSGLLPPEWAYVTENPKRFWIKGLKGGDHITLLYGLLTKYFDTYTAYHDAVDAVLGSTIAQPKMSWVAVYPNVGIFDSPYADENYGCLVLHIDPDSIIDAHRRLSFLPHINTFRTYKPHLTLGYVKKESANEARNILIEAFRKRPPVIHPIEIDYGKFGA